VPIIFRDRLHGESKMSWRIAVEAIWLVPALRFARRAPVAGEQPRAAAGDHLQRDTAASGERSSGAP
jgi:hypothetical protein